MDDDDKRLYEATISNLSYRLAELVAWSERESMDAYRLRVKRAEKTMEKYARDVLAKQRSAMLAATAAQVTAIHRERDEYAGD